MPQRLNATPSELAAIDADIQLRDAAFDIAYVDGGLSPAQKIAVLLLRLRRAEDNALDMFAAER